MQHVNAYWVYELGEFLGRLATRIDTESRAPVLRVLFSIAANAVRTIDKTCSHGDLRPPCRRTAVA
jgi:hypothetical protein